LSERSGNSNISTTLDTFSHIATGLQGLAAKKLDELFDAKKTKLEKEIEKIVQS